MTEPAGAATIRALLGGADLAPLFLAARRILEARDGELGGAVRWVALPTETRVAAAPALGLARTPRERGRLDLRAFDSALRTSRLRCGLVEAIEALDGTPLRHRRTERAAGAVAREQFWTEARGAPILIAEPRLAGWLDGLEATGLLSRLAPGAEPEILRAALAILERLRDCSTRSLAELAVSVGGAHILDAGRPLGTVVLRAIAALDGRELPAPLPAADRRALWETVNVILDPLSTTVLVYGLRPSGDGLAASLRALADAGEPASITLRALLRHGPLEVADRTAFVCEGPPTLEAAARALERPNVILVSAGGNPNSAALTLLRGLRAGGVRLRYHGDFDWPGIAIGERIISGVGARPWHFGAADYRRAVSEAGDAVFELRGPQQQPSWDAPLGRAMARLGVGIHEERFIDELVADLLEASARPVRPRAASGPTGLASIALDDAGTRVEPVAEADWDEWVSAGRTRNYLLGDPLLDWLARHGRAEGFVPDTETPGYDPRTDLTAFVLAQGRRFEAGVLELLAREVPITTIARERGDARSAARAADTFAAMAAGAPLIAQVVLRDPARRTYGVADLLVRSDILERLFPGTLAPDIARLAAPALGGAAHHYRVIDVKFHTFDLTVDGAAAVGDALPYLAQVWVYNEALGRLQGLRPEAAYLLGRSTVQAGIRATGCLDRLARVDAERDLPSRGRTLEEITTEALGWIRRLRRDGAAWSVRPAPSTDELWPHARNSEDMPWHAAKASLARELHELTLLPRMNPERRALAHAAGIRTWDDPAASAASLGIDSPIGAAQLDAVLAANRSPVPVVLPARLRSGEWRDPTGLDFHVDFETVSNLADDFRTLPEIGGQPLIFQIGCGFLDASGAWQFRQWTARQLDEPSERAIVDAWLAHMTSAAARAGVGLSDTRIYH